MTLHGPSTRRSVLRRCAIVAVVGASGLSSGCASVIRSSDGATTTDSDRRADTDSSRRGSIHTARIVPLPESATVTGDGRVNKLVFSLLRSPPDTDDDVAVSGSTVELDGPTGRHEVTLGQSEAATMSVLSDENGSLGGGRGVLDQPYDEVRLELSLTHSDLGASPYDAGTVAKVRVTPPFGSLTEEVGISIPDSLDGPGTVSL